MKNVDFVHKLCYNNQGFMNALSIRDAYRFSDMQCGCFFIGRSYTLKKHNPFLLLSRLEWVLWISSMITVAFCFWLVPQKDALSLFASLVGVTALIFLAKGHILGQFLIILFAILYGIISYCFGYYGEMITYVGMSLPIALLSMISWLRNTDTSTHEVKVSRVSKKGILILVLLTVPVTVTFYFILRGLGTQNLIFSTLSVATSFFAASLTFLRSSYYALAYSANDLILIVLWVLASIQDISYLPMVVCFLVFLLNDMYGFLSWQKRKIKQSKEKKG